MDGISNKNNKESHLEDIKRGKRFYEIAVNLLEVDIDTCVNRIYLGFENISQGMLKKIHSQVSKKHATIWERMSKLYYQGILSFDPKSFLTESYKFHLYVDYGVKEFKGQKIELSKEKVIELLQKLKKLIDEVS